jgi:hypothetical protein
MANNNPKVIFHKVDSLPSNNLEEGSIYFVPVDGTDKCKAFLAVSNNNALEVSGIIQHQFIQVAQYRYNESLGEWQWTDNESFTFKDSTMYVVWAEMQLYNCPIQYFYGIFQSSWQSGEYGSVRLPTSVIDAGDNVIDFDIIYNDTVAEDTLRISDPAQRSNIIDGPFDGSDLTTIITLYVKEINI